MRSPLTPAAFLAFAASKPAHEKYDYCNGNKCPIAQFLKSLGYAHVFVTSSQHGFRASNGEDFRRFDIPEGINTAVQHVDRMDSARPYWNWGALTERLKELA